MTNPEIPENIDELIQQYFLGCLATDDQEFLAAALRESRHCRDRFRMAANLDADLRESSALDSSMEECLLDQTLVSRSSKPPPHYHRWLRTALAASLLISVVAVWQLWQTRRIDQPLTEVAATQDEPEKELWIAKLAVGYDVRFDSGFGPHSDVFLEGEYRLASGAMTMEFGNGVRVSLESPANFDIVDGTRMRLHLGRARANVPETGHGFVIATPGMEFEDLGTEFGVFVDENEDSEIHVFEGAVNLHQENRSTEMLSEDTAISWVAGERRDLMSTDTAAFADSASIGLRRWQKHSDVLRKDPWALFYYDFEPSPRDRKALRNQSDFNFGNFDGRVRGCVWGTGRWLGKGALLFENLGDRVELSIPGTYDALTLMGWLKVDRFDFAVQALMNTVNWEEGEHHWNFLRDGTCRVGMRGASTSLSSPIQPGRWTHFAAVLDATNGDSRYYIDGTLVKQIEWSHNHALSVGDATIGAFGHVVKAKHPDGTPEAEGPGTTIYKREFRGRIDEFGLFSRAFSAEEVADSFHAGDSSSRLWPVSI